MARYRVLSLPSDGMYECTDCAAIVSDRQLHDKAVHGDWKPTVHDHAVDEPPPAKIPPRRYQ